MKKILILSVAFVIWAGSVFSQSLADAKKLLEEEQFSKAIAMLKQLSKSDPSNAEIIYNLGKTYYQVNNDDSAFIFFEQAKKAAPESAYGYIAEGRIVLEKKDKIASKAAFDKAVSVTKSKNSDVIIEIAEAAVQQDTSMYGYVDQLFAKTEKIVKKNPNFFVVKGDMALTNNEGSKAMENYKIAKDMAPTNPRIIMKIADVYRRAKSYQVAYDYYQEAMKLNPNFPPVYRELGEMNFMKSDFVNAKDMYEKYLTLIGNNLDARIKYIKFLFLSKMYDRAIEETNSLMKELPNPPVVLYRLLAYSCYESKKYVEGLTAMEYFMGHQEESKRMTADYNYHGRLLAKNAKDSLAYNVFLKSYSIDSTDVSIWIELLQSSLAMKHYKDAIRWQYKRMSLNSTVNNTEYMKLGQFYYLDKDFKNADSIFTILYTKDSTTVYNNVWKARCLQGLDTDKKPKWLAKPYYQKVIDLGKNDLNANKKEVIESYRYFGFYYFKTRNYNKAIETFQTIKQIDSTQTWVDPIIVQIRKMQQKNTEAQKKKQVEDEEDASLDYLK